MDRGSSGISRSPAPLRGFDLSVDRLYLVPTALCAGGAAGLPLAGGPMRFLAVEVLRRRAGRPGAESMVMPLDTLGRWAAENGVEAPVADRLAALSAPRPDWAGGRCDTPRVMGVVNVTPDSFSDGGDHADAGAAVAHGRRLWAQGAAILDVGGESTRPGAAPVPLDGEIARIEPVIRALAQDGACVSVDTRHAPVMRAALAAGAAIINDVSALAGDADSLAVAAEAGCPVVLMHMHGDPDTMQDAPGYDCALLDIYDYLQDRLAACQRAGIAPARLCVDPGIGFGKTDAHNLSILARLGVFHGLGVPVLLGASRKSFIGRLADAPEAKRRLGGSLAAVLEGWRAGVQLYRAHDVADTVQALRIAGAISRA